MRRSQVPPLPDDFIEEEDHHNNHPQSARQQQQTTATTFRRPQTAGTRRTATTAPAPESEYQHRHHRGDPVHDIDHIEDEFYDDGDHDHVENFDQQQDQEYHLGNNNNNININNAASSPPPPPTVSATRMTSAFTSTNTAATRTSTQQQQQQQHYSHQDPHHVLGANTGSISRRYPKNQQPTSRSASTLLPNTTEVNAFQRTMQVLAKLQSNTTHHTTTSSGPATMMRRPQSATTRTSTTNSSRTGGSSLFSHYNTRQQYQNQPQQQQRSHSARRSASAMIDEEFNNMFDPRGIMLNTNNNNLSHQQQQQNPNDISGINAFSSTASSSSRSRNIHHQNNINNNNNNVTSMSALLVEQTQQELEKVSSEKHALQRLVLELQQENANLKASENEAVVELEESRQREQELQIALEDLEARIDNGEFSSPTQELDNHNNNSYIDNDNQDDSSHLDQHKHFTAQKHQQEAEEEEERSPSREEYDNMNNNINNILLSSEVQTAIQKAMFIISKNFPKEITETLYLTSDSGSYDNEEQKQQKQNVENENANDEKQINLEELLNFLADRCIELCAARQELSIAAKTHDEIMNVADQWDLHERELMDQIIELQEEVEEKDEVINTLQMQQQEHISSSSRSNDYRHHHPTEEEGTQTPNKREETTTTQTEEENMNSKCDIETSINNNNNNTMASVFWGVPIDHWSNKPYQALAKVLKIENNEDESTVKNVEDADEDEEGVLLSVILSQINSSTFEARDIYSKCFIDIKNNNHHHENILVETTMEVARRWGLLLGENATGSDEIVRVTQTSKLSSFFSDHNVQSPGVHDDALEKLLRVISRSHFDFTGAGHQSDVGVDNLSYHSSVNAANVVQKLYLLIQTQHFNHKKELMRIRKLEHSLKILENGGEDVDDSNNKTDLNYRHHDEDDFYYKKVNTSNNSASPEEQEKTERQIIKLRDEIEASSRQLRPSLLESMTFEERLALLLSAAAIFVGHPNLTNDFLIKTRDPIAIRFSSQNILCNYHIATLFSLDEAVSKKLMSSSSLLPSSSSVIFSGIDVLRKSSAGADGSSTSPACSTSILDDFHNAIVKFMTLGNSFSTSTISDSASELFDFLEEKWNNTNLAYDEKHSFLETVPGDRLNVLGWMLRGARTATLLKMTSTATTETTNSDLDTSPWIVSLKKDCEHQQKMFSKFSSSSSSAGTTTRAILDLPIRSSVFDSQEEEVRSLIWLFDAKVIPVVSVVDAVTQSFYSLTSSALAARNCIAEQNKLPVSYEDYNFSEKTRYQVLEQSELMLTTRVLLSSSCSASSCSSTVSPRNISPTPVMSSSHLEEQQQQPRFVPKKEVEAMKWSFGEIQKSLLETISEYQNALSNVLEEKKVLAESAAELVALRESESTSEE